MVGNITFYYFCCFRCVTHYVAINICINCSFLHLSSVTTMLQSLGWKSLQQRQAYSRVMMLYRIRNGLVDIPATTFLKPVPVCTRGHETRYMQMRYSSSMYGQNFFPCAIQMWNSLPTEVYQLSPDSFKAQLSGIALV